MSQAPVMPVFPAFLVSDTTHLSAEQFGAYCLILMATWSNNGRALPDNDTRMAYICRVTKSRWVQRLKPVLIEFFDTADGFWHQNRLETEWERQQLFRQKQKAKGISSAKAKALKKLETTSTAVPFRLEPEMNLYRILDSDSSKEEESAPPKPALQGLNIRAELFGRCLQWLAKANGGKPPDKYRSLIGGWAKQYGDGVVFDVFEAAIRYGPVEPIGWITKALERRNAEKSRNRDAFGSPGFA